MPNWCENYLRLQVPNKEEADKIIAVLESNENDVGLLNHLMPEPDYDGGDKELANDSIHHTSPDWYSWRVNNWGTKWEVSMSHYDKEDNDDGSVTFNLHFESAWGPPTGVYDYVSEKEGWSLFATYIEGGMCFGGYHEEGQDYSFELGSRDDTDAPSWWVDDHSWYYDQQEEWQQEEDAESVRTGTMTHEQFADKWGNDTYDDWVDHMNKVTVTHTNEEVSNG